MQCGLDSNCLDICFDVYFAVWYAFRIQTDTPPEALHLVS